MTSPRDDWDQREVEAFDWADRWNGRFLRALVVGVPLFLWLLLIFGWAGVIPFAGLILAAILTIVVVIVFERLLGPKLDRRARERRER